MKLFCSCVIAAGLLTAAPAALAANLIDNGSFESQIDYSGLDGDNNWVAFFGGGSMGTTSTVDAAFSDPIMPSDGSHHLSIINGGAQDGFSGVTQNFVATPGVPHVFEFDAKQNGPTFNIASEFRIEWRDAAGDFIGGQFDLNTGLPGLSESYETYSLEAIAPAGAATGSAVIAIQTFIPAPGDDPANFFGQLYVDAASVTAIPEPASALLVMLGLASATARRR